MAIKSPNDASLTFIPTQPRGTVLDIPTSYSGGHGFKHQSGDRAIWRAFIVVFFSTLGNFATAFFRIVLLKRKLKEVIIWNKQKELIPHLNTLLLWDSRSSPCLSSEQLPYGPKSRRIRRIAKSDYSLRHICPSAWNNSALTEGIFMKFGSIFRKSAEKISVSLKSDKNNGIVTWRPIHLCQYLAEFVLTEKCLRQNL